ncbi:GNAT family N-acetyltransferase [bacterium]|nr:GNAT family N-acetyltransferase [bacterium]
MTIRKFSIEDAEFCHRIRCESFESNFLDEIGEEAVNAGIKAYTPDYFIQMAENNEFFISESSGQSAGFFTFKQVVKTTAELVLIYFDARYHQKGLGRLCCEFIDHWIMENWMEVRTIFVDTIIPKYNGNFYRKMGYQESRQVVCEFPKMAVSATRFEKRLKVC